MKASATSLTPAVFVGHGSPMNALEDNPWSQAFRSLGKALPELKAIVCVSAHWVTPGLKITAMARPRTIHDFGGFPQALFDMQYPAPGSPSLATQIEKLLSPQSPKLDHSWGLDHGTWSVLTHLRPRADIPVLQVSLDHNASPGQLVQLGAQLKPLREQGVLLLGSGNVVHNLPHAFRSLRAGTSAPPPEWASDFDADVERALQGHETARLSQLHEAPSGKMAHPTAEHYLPLLVIAGAATAGETVSFPIEGFDLGSISMRAVRFG